MIDPSTDMTKVQFGEPISFIGVVYMSKSEGLLTRVERTQRQVLSPRDTPAWVTTHKA